MKFVYQTIFVSLSVLALASCKSDKRPVSATGSEYIRPASVNYTQNDSSAIQQLVQNYVANLKSNNYKAAADMLYKVVNDSIHPLSQDDKVAFENVYSSMSIHDVSLSGIILRSEKNNQVDIVVLLDKDGNISENKGTTTVSLNPVKIEGKWYLTLLDKYAEGVENVYE